MAHLCLPLHPLVPRPCSNTCAKMQGFVAPRKAATKVIAVHAQLLWQEKIVYQRQWMRAYCFCPKSRAVPCEQSKASAGPMEHCTQFRRLWLPNTVHNVDFAHQVSLPLWRQLMLMAKTILTLHLLEICAAALVTHQSLEPLKLLAKNQYQGGCKKIQN